jgi:hypothetical protein
LILRLMDLKFFISPGLTNSCSASIRIHLGKNMCPRCGSSPTATRAKKSAPASGEKLGPGAAKIAEQRVCISFEATDKRCSMGRANSRSTTRFASSQRRLLAGAFYSGFTDLKIPLIIQDDRPLDEADGFSVPSMLFAPFGTWAPHIVSFRPVLPDRSAPEGGQKI